MSLRTMPLLVNTFGPFEPSPGEGPAVSCGIAVVQFAAGVAVVVVVVAGAVGVGDAAGALVEVALAGAALVEVDDSVVAGAAVVEGDALVEVAPADCSSCFAPQPANIAVAPAPPSS